MKIFNIDINMIQLQILYKLHHLIYGLILNKINVLVVLKMIYKEVELLNKDY